MSLPLYEKNLFVEDFLDTATVENFKCPLCNGVYLDPISDNCGDLFCRVCLEKYSKENNICPLTKEPFKEKEFKQMHVIANMLSKQKVQCRNKKNGCDWMGVLSQFKEHLTVVCPKQKIQCTNEGCTVESMREEMGAHAGVCNYRIIECQDCKVKLAFIKLNDHQKVCPKFKLQCPQKCGMTITREELIDHLKDKCDNTEIPCAFASLGCTVKMYKRDMEKHLRDDKQDHLLKVFNNMINFKNSIKEMVTSMLDERDNKQKEDWKDFVQKKFEEFKSENGIPLKPKYYEISNEKTNEVIYLGKKTVRSQIEIPLPEKRTFPMAPIPEIPIDSFQPQKTVYQKSSTFQQEIEQELIESSSDKSSSELNNINTFTQESSPIIEPKELPKKNESIFDLTSIPKGIEIKNNIAKCTESCSKHLFVFTNIDINKNSKRVFEWQVTIHAVSIWLFVGLCDRSKVKDNQFNFKAERDRGIFGFSINGYSWHGNNKEQDNKPIKNFPSKLKGNYTLTLLYYPIQKELHLKYNDFSTKLTNVEPTKSNALTVAGVLLFQKDSIEFKFNNNY